MAKDEEKSALKEKMIKKYFELSKLVSDAGLSKSTQEKIDVVKSRLIKDFGYDEISATDVLNYVASIFARGDVKKEQS